MTTTGEDSLRPGADLPKAVAVIGISARFPGAPDYRAYWRNLSAGDQQIAEIPEDRFDWRRYYGDPLTGVNKTNSKWGGFLESIDRFDAAFFGISPREAEMMDPQQRFMLELTWHCLEDAGYAPSQLAGGRTGVYIGVCNYDYKELQDQFLGRMSGHRQVGSWVTCIPNRISYWYNFHGPSFPIDAACSSSLLAVHEAVQSLRLGECETALAGGVNIICSPLRYIGFGQLGMLSPTGRCHTFDASADGYVRGEGAGMVLLKPLAKALADGDHVYGVIRGSATNHGGKARTLTSPNVYAQSLVVHDAYVDADVSPDTVSYIEAHGTGTPMGDPIEIHGLKRAFQRLRSHFGVRDQRSNYCGLGTVKTHVGHTEAAAGIAGLINVVLALEHRKLPRIHNFESLNPRIELSKSPFYVLEDTREWEPPADAQGNPVPRRAGISSFGAGGANVHVVLEEAPVSRPSAPGSEEPRLVALSARAADPLRELAARYVDYLSEQPQTRLEDVAFTTTAGRDHLEHRLAVVADSVSQVVDALRAFAEGGRAPGLTGSAGAAGAAGELAMLFTGQGSQYAGMGRELYDAYPAFRHTLDRCDEILAPLLEQPLLDVLYGEAGQLIDETAYTQPALFALEYALAELWRSWGIRPTAVMGHSVGEYVAACVAGVFSLEDGLALIAARGRLMQELPRDGAMAAIMAGEARVASALEGHREQVSIAAVNGPEQIVISGRREQVLEIGSALEAQGIVVKPLAVSHAFHSPLMQPMLDAFEAVASKVEYSEPRMTLVSNVAGELAGEEVASARYWRDHVLAAVRFKDGIRALHEAGHMRFLEVGPQPTLTGLGRRCLPEGSVRWLTGLRARGGDRRSLLETLAQLHVEGFAADWDALHDGSSKRRIPLPNYPFEARRHWLDIDESSSATVAATGRLAGGPTHPFMGRRQVSAGQPDQVVYESRQSLECSPGFLADHRVYETPVFPAAAFMEMMLAAHPPGADGGGLLLEDVEIRRPLLVGDAVQTLQCVVDRDGPQAHWVRIFSRPETGGDAEHGWQLHASGRISSGPDPAGAPSVDRAALEAECPDAIEADEFYARGRDRGLDYGPQFRVVRQIRHGEGSALGLVEPPEDLLAGPYLLHPTVLDGCLQILLAVLPDDGHSTYLPVGVRRFRVLETTGRRLWSHVRIRAAQDSAAADRIAADFLLFDDAGCLVAEIEGLDLRRVTRAVLVPQGREEWRDWLYEVDWRPKAGRAESSRPEYFPAPSEMQGKLQEVAATLLSPSGATDPPGIRAELDALGLTCVVAGLRGRGFDFTPGDRFTTLELADRLHVVAAQRRLFGRLLEILDDEGILQREVEGWSVSRVPGEVDPERHLRESLAKYPGSAPELNLLKRTGPRLAEVLAGAVDPLQLMFPDGDTSAATHLYEDAAEPRAANILVARALALALESLPPDRKVRILEIGAGTGGTTASLLPIVPAERTEYQFTDVSAMFTTKAKEKFSAYDFITYRALDIEEDPAAQGIERHSVDLVIAANVVHATRDLAETVQHIRRMLAPGGVLLLLEGSERRRWIDLTFGLLEGWWRFSDQHLRQDYPLIGPQLWKQLLGANGYDAIETVELPRKPQDLVYPQSVVMARADGETTAAESEPPRHWLVCGDAGGCGAELTRRLRESGDTCTLALVGDAFAAPEPGCYTLDPNDPEQVRELLAETPSPLHAAIHLWSLDIPPTESTDSAGPVAAARMGCGSTLNLLQELTRGGAEKTRLWLVTRDAIRVDAADAVTGVAQAPLWGMALAIELEHPELSCVRVDLEASTPADEIDALLRELRIQSADREDHVAFRGGRRYGGRLIHAAESAAVHAHRREVPEDRPCRLRNESVGTPDGLHWVPFERVAPDPHEIEIRVEACGLNFMDVLDALGLSPVPRNGYGLECAGVVVAVGEGVDGVSVGDEVVGIAESCFGSHVTTPAALVVTKPANLSMAEAASIPANFLTAYHALVEVAKVAAGERVLVHAAAGGTGMAAAQLAMRAGAEVWGTASTGKWAALEELGVSQIFNSRTLEFAEQIRERTQGRGIDVVLNSLAGEFIPRSLEVLVETGRFLEIGKTGVWTADQVAEVKPGVDYALIDLFAMCRRDPDHVQAMLQKVMRLFADGELRPVPILEVDATEVVRAFRTMQSAKHIGKIVVSMPAASGEAGTRFNPDATYLIVGGLGGLGPAVARWMTTNGARHFALMGRSGINDAAREPLRQLEEAGAVVRVIEGDVSRRRDVERALHEIRTSMPPLRGVIHSAGVLDDGALMQQSWDRFRYVMGPKVDGAWHLHCLTRELPLDFFVLFSSVASLLGSRGQANHSASNAYLDSLAAYRRARGLPGLSINWGAWAGIGAAARRDEKENWTFTGMDWIEPGAGIEALAAVFRSPLPQVGVVPISDWEAFLRSRAPSSFFDEVRPLSDATEEDGDTFRSTLEETPGEERRARLLDFLRGEVRTVLGFDASMDLDTKTGFFDLGMDSLTSVELRNRLQSALGVTLSPTVSFDHPTIDALADHLLNQVLELQPAGDDEQPPESALDGTATAPAVDDLSDDELADLLKQELTASRSRRQS